MSNNNINKNILDGIIENEQDLQHFTELSEKGIFRAAQKIDGEWVVTKGYQECIASMFKFKQNKICRLSGSNESLASTYYDKINLRFQKTTEKEFIDFKTRLVPGSVVRETAHIGENTVIMQCFVNLGVHIDSGTMIDTWCCLGSCAQIGKNCHISAGVVIGGVLEPVGSRPVIIEDNCTIGANSTITEGVIVEEGSVVSSGCNISSSTKIVNRKTGEVTYGRVPANSVVIPGSIVQDGTNIATAACIIVKQADEKTKSKTTLNSTIRIPNKK